MADRLYREYDTEVLKKLQQVELEVLIEFDRICKMEGLVYFLQFGALLGAVRHKGFIPWDDDIDVGMPREDYEKFVAYCEAHTESEYGYVDPSKKKDYTKYLPYFYKKGTAFGTDALGWIQGIGIDIFVYDHMETDPNKHKMECRKADWYRRLFYLYYRDPVIPFNGIKYLMVKLICRVAHYGIHFLSNPQKLYAKLENNSLKNRAKTTSEWCTTFFESNPYRARIKKEQFEVIPIQFEGQSFYAPKDPHGMLKQIYGDYMKLPPVEKRFNHCPAILDFGEGNVIQE